MPDLKRPLSARFTNALAFAANIHRLQARKQASMALSVITVVW